MSGRSLLWSAALLASLASGSYAQTESVPNAGQDVTGAAIEQPDSKSTPEAARRLAAQNRVAYRLLQQLDKETAAGDNIVVSPASLAMALSLLELGADEKLRAAIVQALGYEQPVVRAAPTAIGKRGTAKPVAAKPVPAAAKPAVKPPEDLKDLLQIIIDLDRDQDMQGVLTLANSIIFDPDAAPNDLAVRGLRETGAKVAVEKLSSEETIRGINEWVSAKTNGLIPTIIDNRPPDAGLIALNALYFKDKWKFPFSPTNTRTARFQSLAGDREVPMMNMARHQHQVQANERFVGIELPYMHERFAMVLVTTKDKPARAAEFEGVASWLGGEGFAPAQVEFAMPRFQLTGKTELLRPLDAMGLKAGRASPTALQGFSTVQQKISQITQKTYLNVDEAGTEAAAVTAVLTARSAARPEKITIDKPFLFALRDRVSGLILMAGYVGSPSAGPIAELSR